jgi:inner membrane protein
LDNLCHTLAGAALGEAGLKHRTTLGMGTLLIASNLPDIDVLVFATDTLPMYFRRGWTHGVLSMVVLPAVFAGVMLGWDRLTRGRHPTRAPANLAGLLLLSYLGNWLHVFMDFLNSYGVRLLMPFSQRWFYGDALYIVDPFLYTFFGGAILIGRWWWKREDPRRPRAARAGLVLAATYVTLMVASNLWARSEVAYEMERAGEPGRRFMVTPVFANPLRREVFVDMGDRYEKGFLWFEPAPRFRPAGYGVNTNLGDPLAQKAAATDLGRQFLTWSRFPFFVIDPAARSRVYLSDYRYSNPSARGNWSSVEIDVR